MQNYLMKINILLLIFFIINNISAEKDSHQNKISISTHDIIKEFNIHQFCKKNKIDIFRKDFSELGYSYSFNKTSPSNTPPPFCVAVYQNIEEAKQGLLYANFQLSIGPSKVNIKLGDGYSIWLSKDKRAGTIHFRRDNVVFMFGWDGKFEDALSFAQKIDELLLNDKDIAPRIKPDKISKIDNIIIPENITSNKEFVIRPEFKNLISSDIEDIVINGATFEFLKDKTPAIKILSLKKSPINPYEIWIGLKGNIILKKEFKLAIRESDQGK